MKKVTVTNFIRDFIFLTEAQTLSIGRYGLAFSTTSNLDFFFIVLQFLLFAYLKN